MANTTLRVFVASPADVSGEREALTKLISELNETIAVVAPEKAITLEALRWETHAYPAAGRPQAIITDQIGDYDIFVGIMWTRFGTASDVADSGTEEEFRLAYDSWREHGRPQIMFYFCQSPSPPPSSPERADELGRVIRFRHELSQKALLWEYERHEDFTDTVRPHLLQVLKKALASGQAGEPVASSPPPGDVAFAESQLRKLSAEYSELRAAMPSGHARTRQMEIVVTKMRSAAGSALPVLSALANSDVPGERLAAIAILQVMPQEDYIDWLGDRFVERQPFIGYHAAMALLTAVRRLHCVHRSNIERAISKGLEHLAHRPNSDRYRTLSGALEELEKRCHEAE